MTSIITSVFSLGLGFRQLGSRTYLMMSTAAAVYAILVGDIDKKVGVVSACVVCACVTLYPELSSHQVQLDDIGCQINCSTMTDHTQEHKFVIARSEVSSNCAC